MGTKLRNLTLISFVIFGFLVSQFTIALNLPKPRSLPPIPGFSNIPSGLPETPVSTPPVKLQKTGNDGSDFGYIVGKVVNADTQEVIENAKITIPELKLSRTSDLNGKLQFAPIYVGKNKESFVTIKVSAPGFGEHTMVDVGVFPGIIATVTLELKKGDKSTKWWGVLRPEEREQKKLPDLEASPLTVGATAYSSQTVPPAYIRVAIRTLCTGTEGYKCDVGKPNPYGAVIRTDVVDFDFYVKHVLPQEWIPSWPAESLKAGAMAVKEYGWYWVNAGGKWPWYNADVDNSTNDQVYNPNISYSPTDSAVDNTAANGWYQNGKIFQSQYCKGKYDSTYSCGTNKMAQKGSWYWADQGKDYQWILNYYYSPTLTYFTIKPRSPKFYAPTVSSNSITLNFSSPGATRYQVNKWANGSWNNVIYFGPNTILTDTGLTPNQMYFYIASAWNPSGWGPWSFNNGHMRASTKPSSRPPAPITDPFYITKSEIGLKVNSSLQSSSSGVTWYALYRVIGGYWQTIYFGSPLVLDEAAQLKVPPDQRLNNPYVDKRDLSFYYFDKNLTASTGYYYTIAAYSPTSGWSDFTNYDGYVYAVTQPAY